MPLDPSYNKTQDYSTIPESHPSHLLPRLYATNTMIKLVTRSLTNRNSTTLLLLQQMALEEKSEVRNEQVPEY
jgi:hypothetical protein